MDKLPLNVASDESTQDELATEEREHIQAVWEKKIRLKVDIRLCSIAGILWLVLSRVHIYVYLL